MKTTAALFLAAALFLGMLSACTGDPAAPAASVPTASQATAAPTASLAVLPPSALPPTAPASSPTRTFTASPSLTSRLTPSPTNLPPTAVTRSPTRPVPLTATQVLAWLRFRVGVYTSFFLTFDTNSWLPVLLEGTNPPVYTLSHKSVTGCGLADQAGRSLPAGWKQTNQAKSLGGRTYTIETWSDPATNQVAAIIYVLDARVRIKLAFSGDPSACMRAAETVLAASTASLFSP